MAQDMYERWFVLADLDNDGKISGAEAVQFFQKSGLPSQVLGRIWDFVCRGQHYLSRPQFNTALGLVSLAQSNNNTLDENYARRYLTGTTPPAPPPTLQGLYEQQPQQQYQSQPPTNSLPNTLQNNVQNAVHWPPLTQQDYQKYQSVFVAMDTQNTGKVKGIDCFTIFMRGGLPREVLKSMWGLVAGDAGELDVYQFVTCLYLMEQIRNGTSLPGQLPPGQFPPLQQDIGSVPNKIEGEVQGQRQGQPLPGGVVPQLPQQMTQFTHTEKSRLENEHLQATSKFEELQSTQNKLLTEKEKSAMYSKALQELMIFKSKMDSSLLQANDQLQRETAQAEQAKKRYDEVHNTVEVKARSHEELKAAVVAAQNLQTEYEQKLVDLENEVQQLEKDAPGQLQELQSQVMNLQHQMQEKENKRNSFQQQIQSLKSQKEILCKQVEELQLCVAALEADMNNLQREVGIIEARFDANESQDGKDLQNMLQRSTEVHNKLVQAAQKCKIPVPQEAMNLGTGFLMNLPTNEMEDVWGDFGDDEGFHVLDGNEPNQDGNPFDANQAKSKEDNISQQPQENPFSPTTTQDLFSQNATTDPFGSPSDPFSSPLQAQDNSVTAKFQTFPDNNNHANFDGMNDEDLFKLDASEQEGAQKSEFLQEKNIQEDPFSSNQRSFSQDFKQALSVSSSEPAKDIQQQSPSFDPFSAPPTANTEPVGNQQHVATTQLTFGSEFDPFSAGSGVNQEVNDVEEQPTHPQQMVNKHVFDPSHDFDPFAAPKQSQQVVEETFSPFGNPQVDQQQKKDPFSSSGFDPFSSGF